MAETNTIDSALLSSGLRKAKNGEEKNKSGGKESFMNRFSGAQDTAEIASDLRQGKIGAAAMGVAEKGVDTAITMYTGGIGKYGLKIADAFGIPVSRIIVYSVLGLVLFLFLIIVAGGYAITHPISTACRAVFGINSFICN